MQQREVRRQRLRRALVRLLNHPANFGVHQLCRLLRDFLTVLDVAPEEQLLFIRADLNRADCIGESPTA